MKKSIHNSARASALQITMALALVAVAAILLATSFRAAPTHPVEQTERIAQEPAGTAPHETDAPVVIGTCDTAGPIEVESTGGITAPTAYATLKAAFDAINV